MENLLNRKEKREAAASMGARRVSFEDLLSLSDVVIFCCDLNKDTKNIMNKEAFALMKPTATVVNISRGEVVNQNDLIQAIKVFMLVSILVLIF